MPSCARLRRPYGRSEFEALSALLDEMELMVAQHLESEDWATAAATWNWKDPDREVFLNQFSDLRIINYYMDVRKQLRALKEQGVVALARVEREMLLKVTKDFKVQLQEEYAQHRVSVSGPGPGEEGGNGHGQLHAWRPKRVCAHMHTRQVVQTKHACMQPSKGMRE